MKRSRSRTLSAVLGLALFAAACGDSSGTASTTTTAPVATTAGVTTTAASAPASSRLGKTAAQLYTTDLSKDCPNPLIVQKDWLAEVEHGAFYQLIGDKGKMSENVYEGPLGSTGINLKIV